tara:strand:- start:3799 stop:4251 length:453 start_codon:yes stop_codon:yes gene_type:complete
MRKSVIIALIITFVAVLSIGAASADDVVPGAYGQVDQSVMGVGLTQMAIGASDRAHANYVNQRSGAGRSLSNAGNGGGADWMFGSSQSEQSWKAAKTIEEAQVYGLVPGDCDGDNTGDAYRRAMGQNRDGYMTENLVTRAQCSEIHTTNK